MEYRKKSVKNTIFFSNTWMVLITLVIFLIVNVSILKIYEDTYKTSMAKSSELDANAYKVEKILNNTSVDSIQDAEKSLANELEELGYQLCVMSGREEIYSNINDFHEVQDYLDSYNTTDDKAHIFVASGLTIVSKAYEENQWTVYATAGEYGNFWNDYRSTGTLILIFLLDGVICIGGLLFMSQFFTRRLTNRIMQPLDALSQGAERMKSGNLSEPIAYSGEAEFEKTCETFNEMQSSILESKEQNERYEKARTDMVAGISHDLRTPLTAIRGTIKGLQDGVAATPELQKKFLDTAYRRTMDMDELLQRLFYFSKLETGNMPMHIEPIHIVSYIDDYVENEKQLNPDISIRFSYETNMGAVSVSMDMEQMKRIFDNLVENSLKYANCEDLQIDIHLSRENEEVKIQYSDNGVGVPEDKLPHIFEEFYRCDESRNKKEGSGLGLYIIKYLVESMNGSINAKNLPGLMIEMQFTGKDDIDA